MNPFYNPLFLLKMAKSYLSDIDRIWRIDLEELKRFQDKAFRKIVNYAYKVPLYNEIYKASGIHPNDIKGINDIEKLPFITKNDLRENFPDKIIPKDFDKNYGQCVSTSGSTGKPVFIYLDRYASILSLLAFARELKAYGGNWKKSKTVLVIDTGPGSIEHSIFANSAVPFLEKFMKLDNIKYIHIGEKPEKIIQEINEFNPEYIGTDPNMFRQLAYLKKIGQGENIQPVTIFSGGSMLDDYTRHYVENAFNTKLFDTYGTSEGGPLAFQCVNGNYHVNSDFVYLEFLDDKKRGVSYNTPGHVIITKLYGGGTPIIRYTGIDDIVTPIEPSCNCGATTQMIKQIEGRYTDLIILPNGKTLSPLTLTGIPSKIMEDFNSYKIKQFQIIQHKIDQIEILIVIDEKQRNIGVKVKDLLKEIEKRASKKIGNDINITVTEADHIQKDVRSDYVKVVISKVN
jgi:phenylacetate-CoA ligase